MILYIIQSKLSRLGARRGVHVKDVPYSVRGDASRHGLAERRLNSSVRKDG